MTDKTLAERARLWAIDDLIPSDAAKLLSECADEIERLTYERDLAKRQEENLQIMIKGCWQEIDKLKGKKVER